jgi:uncharacterized tellurite resistance protein B-like protein
MAAHKSSSCCLRCKKKLNLYMTVIEVKTEIQKVLDEVPENVLPQILDYLKQIQNQSADQAKFNNNLKRILTEDNDLFERLAQ